MVANELSFYDHNCSHFHYLPFVFSTELETLAKPSFDTPKGPKKHSISWP